VARLRRKRGYRNAATLGLVLLGPVLAANRTAATGAARDRLDTVCSLLAEALGATSEEAPAALQAWAWAQGLPGLSALGVDEEQHLSIATAALQASSMKGNPVLLSAEALREVLERA